MDSSMQELMCESGVLKTISPIYNKNTKRTWSADAVSMIL